jgi:hypothetical protein
MTIRDGSNSYHFKPCAALRLARIGPQPTDVRVPEAADRAGEALAGVRMGRVRIALRVGVGVVLAVVGDPLDDRALHRPAAHDRQQVAHARGRLERAVGQQAVVADRDAEAGGEVEGDEDRQVGPADDAVPQQDDGGEEGQERHDDRPEVQGALQLGHSLDGGRNLP